MQDLRLRWLLLHHLHVLLDDHHELRPLLDLHESQDAPKELDELEVHDLLQRGLGLGLGLDHVDHGGGHFRGGNQLLAYAKGQIVKHSHQFYKNLFHRWE